MMENISQQISLNNNLIYGLRRSVFDFFNTTLQNSHPNPLNKFGAKCFSQNDEDGIILEILRRINLLGSEGVFAEFGVGDGTENNTLILASLGWTGFWMGGKILCLNMKIRPILNILKIG
jgi:hypothetical protein